MNLKEKIVRAASYINTDFYAADNIGIIARGPSVYRLDLCYKQFNHCYLAGEFNHFFSKMGSYVYGKDIVLCIMQQDRYITPQKLREEFGINNLQIRFQSGSPKHKKCQKKYPDLKVIGFDKSHYDITEGIGEKNTIFTTGIAPLITALRFRPKNIYIIGLDFYNMNVKSYFVSEDHDVAQENVTGKCIKDFRYKMINSIYKACDNFPGTNFYLYTTYGMIKPRKNLHITYV